MISKTIDFLNSEQTILYPTDTVWGLGCDATSVKAVEKIYDLKQRKQSKALIILVSSVEMLQNYVTISDTIQKYLNSITFPTTVIYDNPINLAENLINKEDNSVAIRIVNQGFCSELITKFGKPIVSTSANISGETTPKMFAEINDKILNKVDFIVKVDTEKINTKSSKIVRVVEDKIIVLRE